jgi:hypothetical protein
LVYAAERNVHMSMLCIEVCGGHPSKASPQISFHALNELARMILEIQPFAELGGHNHFE